MLEITKVGPRIGAAIRGVDVRTLDAAGFAPIYQAWLDYNVIVVKDQHLTIPEFLVYSRRFGNVVPHVHWHVIPRYTDDAHFPNAVWGERRRDAAPRATPDDLARLLRRALAADSVIMSAS